MSILTSVLPDYIIVDGTAYYINTDFRVWLEFDNVISSREIKPEAKPEILFRLCFNQNKCKILPKSIEAAISALYEFYTREKSLNKTEKPERFIFSFEEDADYIYAAFLSQYGIDLLSVPYMHWYAFMALFKGLREDCRLMKIISVRSVNTEEIKDKERKKSYQRLQKVYALKDKRSELEKDYDAANALFDVM